MQKIIAPINPTTTQIEAINNLQDVLQFLVRQSLSGIIEAFRPLIAPDGPTRETLEELLGQLSSDRQQNLYGVATRQLVLFFQIQNSLGDNLNGYVEEKTAAKLNEFLTALGAFPNAPLETFMVNGIVTDSLGRSGSGLRVIAYDQDMRRRQRIGTTSTNEKGYYQINYDLSQFQQADRAVKPTADLIVEVLLDDGMPPLATSETRFQSKQEETINLTIPAQTDSPSEFEQITELVTPLLQGQGEPLNAGDPPSSEVVYADLAPHMLTQSDVEFIQREIELNAEAIQIWAEAAQLQHTAIQIMERRSTDDSTQQTTLQNYGWAFFFAWLRITQTSGLDSLLIALPEQWLVTQRQAETARHVKTLSEPEWVSLAIALRSLRDLAATDATRNAGNPLIQILELSPSELPQPLKQQAFEIYETNGFSNPEAFLSLAETNPDATPQVNLFVRTLRLHNLTNGDQTLTRLLNNRLDNAVDSLEPLAALSRDNWMELVNTAANQGLEINQFDQPATAAKLQIQIEQLYPATALSARLNEGSIQLQTPESQALTATVLNNREGANILLTGQNIDSPAAQEIVNENVRDVLRNYGRYGRMGLNFEIATDLINQGFPNPGALTRLGSDILQNEILNKYPPEIGRKFIQNHAEIIRANQSLVGEIVASGRQIRSWNDLIPGENSPSPVLHKITEPTLRGIFGDLDECLCPPCESVLGLPAYLVDLLNLLNKHVGNYAAKMTTGLKILSDRRPDIVDIELSCENAESELLHIDLALEVLEWHVSKQSLVVELELGRTPPLLGWFNPIDPELFALLQRTSTTPLTNLQARRHPTTPRIWYISNGYQRWQISEPGSSQATNPSEASSLRLTISSRIIGISILKNPEATNLISEQAYRNPAAYEELKQAIFPWSLPWDLSTSETNLYLERLHTSRYKLLSLQRSSSDRELAEAALGLTTKERELITIPRTGDELWEAWGFENSNITSIYDPASNQLISGTPEQLLQRASVLIDRTGLTLEQLEEVLATRFVGEIRLSDRGQCKTSKMRLDEAYADTFDRIHRLTRLWHKLEGWSIALLDSAIVALNRISASSPWRLIDDVLAGIAKIQTIKESLKLPVEKVLAMHQPLANIRLRIDQNGSPISLFDRVFLSEKLDPAARETFRSLQNASSSLPVVPLVGAIASAIKIKSADILPLLDILGTGGNLTPTALLGVYRYHTLSKALGLSIRELQLLITITTLDPFAPSPQPSSLTIAEQRSYLTRLERFVLAYQQIEDSGIGIELLAKVLLPETNPLLSQAKTLAELKTREQLEKDLKELRDNLRKAMPEIDANNLPRLQQQVQELLSLYLGQDKAAIAIVAISTAAAGTSLAASDRQIVGELAIGATSRPLGTELPLLSIQEVTDLLAINPNPSQQNNLQIMQSRLQIIFNRIIDRLHEQLIVETVTDWTNFSREAVSGFLQDKLPVDPAASGGNARQALSLFKEPQFWNPSIASSASIDPALLAWAHRLDLAKALFQTIDPAIAWQTSLPITDWREILSPASIAGVGTIPGTQHWETRSQLLNLLWLAKPENLSVDVLQAHLNTVLTQGGTSQGITADSLKPLSDRLGINKEVMFALATQALGQSPSALELRSPALLQRLLELAFQSRQLKATNSQLEQLVGTDATQAARTARQLLAAQVEASAWANTVQPISDALRKQQRDALVAWLLHNDAKTAQQQQRQQWTSADRLYEHYLIDPQIQPCFKTTRILQAVSSVQLFVQRILFGLEKEARPSPKLKEIWSSQRSYRLWEANRKVFMYPENWLFPELRDDKSSCFQSLESTLGQGELTQDLARQAFGQFLIDVSQTAQIRVVGMFEDVEFKGDRRDLYVVGRTLNPPYLYYWRRCGDFGQSSMEWSPWQQIELDIQGDHVLPFVMGKQLYIAWPRIEKKSSTSLNGQGKWKITLAWSYFNGQRWSRINTSRESDQSQDLEVETFSDERSGFVFRCRVENQTGQASISQSEQASIQVFAMQRNINATPRIPDLPIPNPVQRRIDAPPEFFKAGQTSSLANIIRDGFNQLPEKYKKMLETYCTKRIAIENPQARLDLPGDYGPGAYWPIIPFDYPTGYDRHRGQVDAWQHIRDMLPSISDQKIKLNEFVNQFLEYAYSRRIPGIYYDFVNDVILECHVRRIKYRVFAKVEFSGNTGFYELNQSHGPFYLMLNGRRNLLLPGQEYYDIRMGEGSSSSCTLSWGRANLDSLPLPTTQISKGQDATQWLHFQIDVPPTINLESVGIKLTREFRQVMQFVLNRSNTVHPQLISGNSLAVPSSQFEPWMNGYREDSKNNLSSMSPLILQQSGSPVSVFSNTWPDTRFWIVGATLEGSNYQSPQVWHFCERDSSCYIDLSLAASQSEMRIFSDAENSAKAAFSTWGLSGSLPTGFSQIDSGGFELLPTLTSNFQQSVPVDIRSGQKPFDNRLPSACYNWEIYFHAPLLIADQLTKQHRFEDAERWLRLVFDPTSTQLSDPKAFLHFRVFHELEPSQTITADLTALAQAAASRATQSDITAIKNIIDRSRRLPYRPFMIARRRHLAFLWATLFAYLDNLLSWADSLYRRDTREAIAEATQLYVLASRILGPKPKISKAKKQRSASSYADLNSLWDDFANAWIDAGRAKNESSDESSDDSELPSPVGFLYFCIPFNDKLITYWNTVEDRLFNIRYCRNIEGITRDLPLLDPPIDPELLVRATAAGLNLDDVLNGLYAPPSHYRYSVLAARATELANETRSLGAALLSALEKRDAEQLALLRSSNEITLLKLVKDVRQQQIEEAQLNLDALKTNRKSVEARYSQYMRLLGRKGAIAPVIGSTGAEESMLGVPAEGLVSQRSNLGLIREENEQYTGLEGANTWSTASGIAKVSAGATHMISSILAGASVVGATGKEVSTSVAHGLSAVGDAFSMVSQGWRYYADQLGMLAGHVRRRDEWAFQSNQTLKELQQIDKQILASEIRIAITTKELENQTIQIEQSQVVDEYLRSKYTNNKLYDWMVSQLSQIHSQAYRMALDLARKTESAAIRELGTSPLNIIRNDYWNSLRSGLLAGDRLALDLKRLEVAYLDRNRRELEITKHISLLQLDPLALIKLRTTASCEIAIPEALFDMDFPGHYFRRIKTVSITVPCVVGPYTSVNGTLTLLSSQIRDTNQVKGGSYDSLDNYRVSYLPIQSIATSSAQNDSGLFELNFRDERYLPFECAGTISNWRFTLPNEFRQFDYGTISDVILHIRYTARDGGETLKDKAIDNLNQYFGKDDTTPSLRMFNLRQEFPSQWHRFLNPSSPGSGNNFELEITSNLFPIRDANKKLKVNTIWFLARCKNAENYTIGMTLPGNNTIEMTLRAPTPAGANELKPSDDYGDLHFIREDVDKDVNIEVDLTAAPVKWQLRISRSGGNVVEEVEDLLLVLGYEWTDNA
jgi:hypothetical protein